MIDENTKNSVFLESNDQLNDLKEQILEIKNDSITLSDLEDYVTKNELDNYLPKSDFEQIELTINNLTDNTNLISSKVSNLEKQDLSIYVSNDNFEKEISQIDKKISDISTSSYTKSEIDNKLSNIIHNDDLDNYVTKSDLSNENYLTSDKLNEILNKKSYLTEHQSLEDYAKKTDIEKIVNDKVDSEYTTINNYYNLKVNRFMKTYLSTIKELGYTTSDDVSEIVNNSLIDYIKTDELENIIDKKDFVNSEKLYDYVKNYVLLKLSNDNYVTDTDVKEYVQNNIPSKTSQLFNDSGYLTEHQSLKEYIKKSELSNYVLKDEFSYIVNNIKDIDTSVFLTKDDIKGVAMQSDIPTKLSDMFNDTGYLTKHQSLDDYVKKTELLNYVLDKDVEKKIIDVVSNIDISDKIPDIDLTNYAKKTDIPVKISELVNDKGYLTYHQSLRDYVKKSDLIDFVTESKLDEIKNTLKYTISKDDIKDVARKSDIPTKLSDMFNDVGYLTKHQSLNEYAQKSDLSNYISRKEFNEILSSLNKDVDNEKYLTKDDIKGVAMQSDIPTKLSEMFNDVGYLTKHQSLDDYVKKTDVSVFATKYEFDDLYEKIKSLNLDEYVKLTTLQDYASKRYVIEQIITNKQDLKPYAKLSDLDQFVKKTSLPNYDNFLTTIDLPDMSKYLEIKDIDNYGFAKLEDIPNVYKIINNSLSLYVKDKTLNEYKSFIEKQQYQTKVDVYNILDDYVKKSDIDGTNIDKDFIKDIISDEILKIHVPSNLSELKNDVGYLTKHQSLKEYVKRREISNFITVSDADKTYLKINDFKLPNDIIYKDDIKDNVTKSELMLSIKDFVKKSYLDDYLIKSDFNKELTSVKTSLSNQTKSIEQIVSDISDINDKLYNGDGESDIVTKSELEDYVKNSDFNTYTKLFDEFKESSKTLFKNINSNIIEQKTWVSNEINDIKDKISNGTSGSTTDIDDVDLSSLMKSLTPELESRFLLKEDYRGIKNAATINFAYNEYPDLFFKVLNNTSNELINDGFYVIEEKAYIVRNNKIIPICDRKSPHWEIETSDENWED